MRIKITRPLSRTAMALALGAATAMSFPVAAQDAAPQQPRPAPVAETPAPAKPERAKPSSIKPDEVPQAVRDALQRIVPGATVTEAAQARGEEDTIYYLTLTGDKPTTAKVEMDDGGDVKGSVTQVIPFTDLPEPVATAAKKHLSPEELGEQGSAGAGRTVLKLTSLRRVGEISYEWELRNPEREYTISGDGSLVRVFQRLSPEELPAPVKDAIAKAYPQQTPSKPRKYIDNGVVVYRMEIPGKTSDDEIDISVTADGQITVRP